MLPPGGADVKDPSAQFAAEVWAGTGGGPVSTRPAGAAEVKDPAARVLERGCAASAASCDALSWLVSRDRGGDLLGISQRGVERWFLEGIRAPELEEAGAQQLWTTVAPCPARLNCKLPATPLAKLHPLRCNTS